MPYDERRNILEGRSPEIAPPRVKDFEELDKKSIDNLVDYMKYVATASGITMGFYAKTVTDNIQLVQGGTGKSLLFSPVLFWFLAVLFSVIGIFPRAYKASSDYEKEIIVMEIRNIKRRYSILSILCFISGFFMFVYVTAAMLWKLYPLS